MGHLPLLILLATGGPEMPLPAPDPQPFTQTANSNNSQDPLTGADRLKWVVRTTMGPSSLFVGALQAGWGNLSNRPPEYGQGMEGFGKRFGLRLTSIGTSNVMEASLGAIWGEDPRYHRAPGEAAKGRFGHAIKMTVMAQKSDGSLAPAYARYIAYAGSNAISDAWRPDSQVTVGSTVTRIGERFAGRLLGNLFKEFWPDLKSHTFLNKH